VADLILVRSMRVAMIVLMAAASLSFGAERAKYVMRAEHILSVCADGAEVEVVYIGSCCPGDAFQTGQCSFDFSFIDMAVLKQIQLASIAYRGNITVRWRLPDAVSADQLAKAIEMHRRRPNQAMQRTAGSCGLVFSITSPLSSRSLAASPTVADLVSR
jgi:hypothetical protein